MAPPKKFLRGTSLYSYRVDSDKWDRFTRLVRVRGEAISQVLDAAVDEYIENCETDDGFYDEANIRWLKGSIAQMSEGKTVTKTIEELERMADE